MYIWDDRSLSFGDNRQLEPHRHGSAELVVALDQPFDSVLGLGIRVTARSMLIPPNVLHQNRHRDAICPILYLDAEGRDYEILTRSLQINDGIYRDLPFEDSVRAVFKKIHAERPKPDDCYRSIEGALIGAPVPGRLALDPRIERILERIRDNPGVNYSIDSLAIEAGLSSYRLQHLFTEQVGLPYRKYRTWLRLKHAVRLVFDGESLTRAAYGAGFTDSSHFTNSFRKHFGATPSGLLTKRQDLTVYFG